MVKTCPGHGNSVPSQLSLQWFCKNSYSWAHNLRSHVAGTDEPKGC